MEDKEMYQILKELKETGASEKEADELMNVLLNNFSSVKKIERSYAHKRKFLVGNPIENKRFLFFPKLAFAPIAILSFMFLVGVVSIATASQKSLPGESLYGVKRLTEKMRTAVDPSFQSEIVVRRSEEIKELSEHKKDSGLIKQTVNDYETEVKEVKDSNEKIDESIKNLEEAKQNVSEEDKKEIERVLENGDRNSAEDVKSAETKSGEINNQEQTFSNKDQKEGQKLDDTRQRGD